MRLRNTLDYDANSKLQKRFCCFGPFWCLATHTCEYMMKNNKIKSIADTGNTIGGSITVPLTSCLTGLD